MALARTGPYGLVRNPLYLGNLLIILGAIVASEVLWLVPLAAVWSFAVYALVVRYYEEPMIGSKYGEEWRRYASEVPAWFPRWRRPAPGASAIAGPLAAQALQILWLVPFVLKEMHLFGLGIRG